MLGNETTSTSLKQLQTLGNLFPISVATQYQADPVDVLKRLAHSGGEHILLESAEIDSRQNLKSLFMIDASLKLVCRGQQVTVQALSENGECILSWLRAELNEFLIEDEASANTNSKANAGKRQCVFEFTLPKSDLTEQERLSAPANTLPLRTLQQQLTALQPHPFAIFLAGVFAYDLLATFEQLPAVAEGINDCPDYQFYLAETLLIMDHAAQQTELLGVLASGNNAEYRHQQLCQRLGELMSRMQAPFSGGADLFSTHSAPKQEHSAPKQEQSEPKHSSGATAKTTRAKLDFAKITSHPKREEFKAIVLDMKKHIAAGDIFQVVPSRNFTLPCTNALLSYAELKKSNPSPYMFYLRTAEFELFGASPESALKFTASNRQVELYPIAGTRSRARDAAGNIKPDQDSRIELALRQDQKELAEHMMLVDLARNDLARIARTGSRYVADLLKVDRYSHVMHLVSRVVATLRDDLDAIDAYRACMNMGTLVGAPKISAASLIRGAEGCRRGSYGGAVGYLNGAGDMDTCIVIRSAYVKNGNAIVQAGAGVVFDSDADAEVAETEQKAGAVLQAILHANEALSAENEVTA
ncbi:anthranilate synthase component 1 [Aliidiomarina iranensis]|uniref:anthranilate synthase n=1 Tax=Aliidiomarina iranensis TaxID=1434071 RepID=A0A432VSF1_9GAMM|nr:anthranilate synthase component 1 [Aliidiomarina iranensis]RUO19283.1 anthranilate synthase component 1 [Aliidiomarina iranensis]